MEQLPIAIYHFPSKKTTHKITRYSWGWECDCEYYQVYSNCRHIRQIMYDNNLRPDRCEYKNSSGLRCSGTDITPHHLIRRSNLHYLIVKGQKIDMHKDVRNILWLCFKCHARATDDKKFEIELQRKFLPVSFKKLLNLYA